MKEIPLDGSAFAAGLRQADQILTVNCQSIHENTCSQVIAVIQNAFVIISIRFYLTCC